LVEKINWKIKIKQKREGKTTEEIKPKQEDQTPPPLRIAD
jgi:hypothetical protein